MTKASTVVTFCRDQSSWIKNHLGGAMWLVILRYAEELNIQIDQHAEAETNAPKRGLPTKHPTKHPKNGNKGFQRLFPYKKK